MIDAQLVAGIAVRRRAAEVRTVRISFTLSVPFSGSFRDGHRVTARRRRSRRCFSIPREKRRECSRATLAACRRRNTEAELSSTPSASRSSSERGSKRAPTSREHSATSRASDRTPRARGIRRRAALRPTSSRASRALRHVPHLFHAERGRHRRQETADPVDDELNGGRCQDQTHHSLDDSEPRLTEQASEA